MRHLLVALAAALPGQLWAQAISLPQVNTTILNTSGTISLNPAVTTGTSGSLTLGSSLPPAIASNPSINTSGGAITLRAASIAPATFKPATALVPAAISVNPATTTFLAAEATRLTATAPVPTSLPQIREGVFVQPGTALTSTISARQAVIIDGRLRLTQ